MPTKETYPASDLVANQVRNSGASNASCVDDNPGNDGDATYNGQTGPGSAEDVYNMTTDDIPAGSTSITVRVYGTFRWDGVNEPSGPELVLYYDGASHYSDVKAPTTTYTEYYYDWAGLTVSQANAAKAGSRIYGTGGPPPTEGRATAIRKVVTYTEPAASTFVPRINWY